MKENKMNELSNHCVISFLSVLITLLVIFSVWQTKNFLKKMKELKEEEVEQIQAENKRRSWDSPVTSEEYNEIVIICREYPSISDYVFKSIKQQDGRLHFINYNRVRSMYVGLATLEKFNKDLEQLENSEKEKGE
jgi:hypothetical protein